MELMNDQEQPQGVLPLTEAHTPHLSSSPEYRQVPKPTIPKVPYVSPRTIGRITLIISKALSDLLNSHFPKSSNPTRLRDALLSESLIVHCELARLNSPDSEREWQPWDPRLYRGYSREYVRCLRSLRRQAPMTNKLLDSLKREFGWRFKWEWLESLTSWVLLYSDDLTFDAFITTTAEVAMWPTLFDGWAARQVHDAAKGRISEEELNSYRKRMERTAREMKNIVAVLGPRIDLERGENYVRSLIPMFFDDECRPWVELLGFGTR
ncbi:hypothetical protein BJ508DRAFT_327809 [Ascobolus immersus RN42]|uniref:Uncharacterized protein n=1 Tax=Ascobolus immersus RN42 TaxID=1160509 RepID=A0A3N4I1H0_ASCIM|nr:hypothetical protein BJ508DRAFT_327809 [Ascobolus immersus RN42]